jgi:hypothetical protein
MIRQKDSMSVKPGVVMRIPVLRKNKGVKIAVDENCFRDMHPLLDH